MDRERPDPVAGLGEQIHVRLGRLVEDLTIQDVLEHHKQERDRAVEEGDDGEQEAPFQRRHRRRRRAEFGWVGPGLRRG